MISSTSLSRLFTAIILLGSIGLNAQVVINEISYNPPESNTDSLEFIELYNAGNTVVNIEGWHFTSGVEDTFPNVDLQPGDYFVTAISAQAMMSVYGIQVHQWSDGAANNGGETIILVDASENLIDSVLFEDSDPWPTEPDGSGPSLELKDPALDNNDGANWQFSGGTTGVIINGFEISGTPGAQNSGGGSPGPAVTIAVANFQFNPKHVVVAAGETVRWINNEAIAHNVNGTQAAYPNNPESFTSGAPAGMWQYDFVTAIPGLNNYHCDPHKNDGMVGTVSVYDPLNYTDFPLSHLRLNNDNGSALFDGVPTTVTGVVHGVNFQPSGYSFYIIDENNVGINVFSFDPGSYVVTKGDLLKVSGVIDQFNGLLEIIPDDIEVVSSGNALNFPQYNSEITEEDESSYLWIDGLLIDSVGSISTSGFTIYTTDFENAKIEVRVDADAETGTVPEDFPEGGWLVVWEGIGTQFDNSFPYTSGYQVLALVLSTLVDGVQTLDKAAITIQPNPAINSVFFKSELTISEIEIYSMEGKKLLTKQVNQSTTQFDINALPTGMHMVKAYTDQGIWTSLLSVIK